jgi:ribosomal protein L22
MADEEKTETKAKGRKPASPSKAEPEAGAGKDAPKRKPATRKAAEEPKAQPKPKPEAEPVAPMVRASARFVRISPRKVRLVADQVRGLHIERARALLLFSPRGAAQEVAKVIDSAAANAENNFELVADDMKVAEITVDEGPTLRRYRPRALGRATRINKRTSHISVALTPEEEA